MTDDKTRRVLDSALQAFARYGFKRVTMGDLAEAAGMSRPALYLLFPNKEAVFTAVVTDTSDQALAAIAEGVDSVDTRRERLRLAFEVWSVRAFELMHQSPDAREIVEASHAFAADAMEAAYAAFSEQLVAILGDAPACRGLRAEAVAATLIAASVGFKQQTDRVEAYRALLHEAIDLVEAALG